LIRERNSFLTQQFLEKYKMAVIPHLPYSPDLAPCDFFLFPKMKPIGRQLDTIEELQAELQRVLDTLQKRTSRKLSKNGGDGGTSVYMQEGTTLRVMVANRPYGESYFFLHYQSRIFWIPPHNIFMN
jgi:hypothetical protein